MNATMPLQPIRHALALAAALALGLAATAQDDNLGTRSSLQVGHKWGAAWYGNVRVEYRTATALDSEGRRGSPKTDLWFARATLGAQPLPWLKADLGVDRCERKGTYSLRALPTVTLCLRQGNLTASLRERYMASFTPSADEGSRWSHVFRSQLRVGYHAQGHLLAPYMAVELYGWRHWQQTHHFVGTQLMLGKPGTVDLFYLLASGQGKPDAHVLGVGYSVNI